MIWVLLLSAALLLLVIFLLSFRSGTKIAPEPARQNLPPARTEDERTNNLPDRYGSNEIVAMVKDPYWAHAYWEITAAKQQEFSEEFGPGAWEESRPVIRVHDVTEVEDFNGSNAPFDDIEIDDFANSWYIHLGRPDHSFYLDLGRRLPGGHFVTLARSNRVSLPSNAPSNIIDPLWPPLEALWSGQVLAWGSNVGSSPSIWGISSAQMPARERSK